VGLRSELPEVRNPVQSWASLSHLRTEIRLFSLFFPAISEHELPHDPLSMFYTLCFCHYLQLLHTVFTMNQLNYTTLVLCGGKSALWVCFSSEYQNASTDMSRRSKGFPACKHKNRNCATQYVQINASFTKTSSIFTNIHRHLPPS
jgi:hypothetical protein